MHATFPLLEKTDFPAIKRNKLEVLQVNVGYYCNLSCTHCHVNAGPKRTEMMDEATADSVLSLLDDSSDIHTLDLTGGAPELNAQFRKLVEGGRARGLRVIDRCNLTVLEEPGQEDLAQYLADQQVDIVASLPCFIEDNVDKQRGKGVFDGSIRCLEKLNSLGFGRPGSPLKLDLVYNPQGPVLPPPQEQLELDYKKFLGEQFGIEFNGLLTITNLPIQRFGSMLISKGQFHPYMDLLKSAYRPENLSSVMCKNTISIDYDGFVYDCDFNQMLAMPIGTNRLKRTHIDELVSGGVGLDGMPIAIGDHCYGCTAGQGSSCGGALS